MSIQDHGERILRELGLTFSQARIYITLVRLGEQSTAKAISNFSNVARQDVYRTLADLQKVSLVEMVIGKLAMFRAIPMHEAVSILMERRERKTHALLSEATELLERLPEIKPEGTIPQEHHQFVLIPKKEMLIRRTEKAIKVAQKSVLVITPWRELTQWLLILGEFWSQALIRGVNVRWITEIPMNANSNQKSTKALLKNPHFKLKTMPNRPKKRFIVYDDKEVFIATSNSLNAGESPALWTNNSAITYILKDYFEMKWKLATEYEPQQLQ